MSTHIVEKSFQAPVELGVADAVIAGLAKRLQGAKADTPAGYEVVRRGLAECRTLRRQAKDGHRELKESALRWGRACDNELRRVNDLVIEVERPLVDDMLAAEDRKEAEREKLAAKLCEERKPDKEKLLGLAAALTLYELPEVTSEWADEILELVHAELMSIRVLIGEAIERMK